MSHARTKPYSLAEAMERLGGVTRQAIYARERRGEIVRTTTGHYPVAAIEALRIARRERLQAELLPLLED